MEDVIKSLIFKGQPAERMLITMRFFRASPGVACTYCHAEASESQTALAKLDPYPASEPITHCPVGLPTNRLGRSARCRRRRAYCRTRKRVHAAVFPGGVSAERPGMRAVVTAEGNGVVRSRMAKRVGDRKDSETTRAINHATCGRTNTRISS